MTASAAGREDRGTIPGEAGMWVIIYGDMLVFSAFFVTFLLYRNADPGLYQQSSHQLSRGIGLFNTLLLLTSSWSIASAVQKARAGAMPRALALTCVTILCGLGFVVAKIFEYSHKIGEGITLKTNDFFMFYYMFTGIHLLHVIIGLGVLLFVALRLRGPGEPAGHIWAIECGASFWHLVDLLWIILFALLYLL